MKFIPGQKKIYVAPILANGELSIQLGPDGTMALLDEPEGIHNNPSRYIWWQARRRVDLQTKNLIPFGRFVQTLAADGGELIVTECEQELDPAAALIQCKARYSDGSIVETEAFVAADCNLIALKKTFSPKTPFTYSFTYALCGREGFDQPPKRLECSAAESFITYRAPGQDDCRGCVRVFADADAAVSAAGNRITLSTAITEPCTICYYILLTDTKNAASPLDWSLEKQAQLLAEGWEQLESAHRTDWAAYYAEGGASVGDPLLDAVYMTAQYHQRCFTTKWSLPVAINDACWEGKFFGFDEFFMLSGLLTTGHYEAAMRTPHHRLNGLAIARKRCSSKHHAARYPWETIEDGTEAATPGFWYDHIFHMATIPLGAYECWRYTNDRKFLADMYPMISSCAEFFRLHMLYRVEGGRLIVGKCTDLERLGSAVENPYMTTCSVIATFRAFADCAHTLGCDAELADESEKLADDLLASLPHDGVRYVPYPGCTERSIASYAGTFPFRVEGLNRDYELAAIRDFAEYEDVYGNMYATGRGVCSWYGGWKAIAYARLGMPEEAYDSMRYVAERTGDFGEVYEIGDKKTNTYYHPWFTTAAGMYIHAINEILLQSDKNSVTVAAALSERVDSFDFTLASHGDVRIHAAAKNGLVTELAPIFGQNCSYDYVDIRIPARFTVSEDIGGERIGSTGETVIRFYR